MARLLLQPSFTGGELSPSLHGRVDIARYGTSLARAVNMIVRPYGGISSRPGLGYCGDGLTGNKTRLAPFVVRRGLAYLVEFGHERARFWFEGQQLVDGMGDPVEVVTPYAAADLDGLRWTQSADALFLVHPEHAPRVLRRVGPAEFGLDLLAYSDGPFRDINPNEAVRLAASAPEGSITITANAAVFQPAMVGHLIYIEAERLGQIRPWTVGDREVTVGTLRRSDGKTYRARTVPSAPDWTECGPVRPIHERGAEWDGPGDLRTNGAQSWRVGVEWEYLDAGFGVARITAVASNGLSATATVLRRMPDAVIGGFGAPVETWNLTGTGAATSFAIAGATSPNRQQYQVTIDGVLIPPSTTYLPPGGGTGTPPNWGDKPPDPFPPFVEP
jgi:hypothetical protein